MRTDDFDYALPEELIAQTPAEPRSASRLLVLDRAAGALAHHHFGDILGYLRPGDLLVANDSRVIPARLFGHKVPGGGRVELLLLAKRGPQTWEALAGGKRVRPGTVIALDAGVGKPTQSTSAGVECVGLPTQPSTQPPAARVLDITPAGGRLIEFDAPIEPWLGQIGQMPLPPYIHAPLADRGRYQTVYARADGSAAAPTAGLHFTPELMDQARRQGAAFAFVTLHIGLDTFRPVAEERVEEHQIHTETCYLEPAVAEEINAAKRAGRRVIAVGTTAVRTLESAGRLAAARGLADAVAPLAGPTALFIYPGYAFRVVDAMITNFHLPRSTLLMLVSAFAGRPMILDAYAEAVRQRYRFYSFGDAMLIL